MTTLLSTLSTVVSDAFAACGYPREAGVVKVSDRPDLAPFQCNGAMAAAKARGENPRAAAQKIADHLIATHPDFFAKIDVAGPGFLNLHVSDNAVLSALRAQAMDEKMGIAQVGTGQQILLDYGGPNAAKAMHVGHLRSAIIGDTLRRIFLAQGYNALGDIHLGDWGLQAGHVISELEIRHPDWPYFVPGALPPFEEKLDLNFEDLGEIYPAASTAAKADPARLERSRAATLALQQGHPGYNDLWNKIVDMSKEAMRVNYGHLNVEFDLWLGEKDVDHRIPDMVSFLKTRGYAVESEGAWVVPVARNDDKKEMPPLILVKSDGAFLYSTTDLATVIDRAAMHPAPDRVIILADNRQALHFEQVFRAAHMVGFVPNGMHFTHAGFGTMNGTDGKPFKTRAGGVLRLEDLIAMAHDKARARMNESHVGEDLDPAEQEEIARMVAVAAVKFADLKNPRHVDYVFDLDAMTSFEGKTGPYLLYQAVRIRSILARARVEGMAPGDWMIEETSRPLILLLLDYPNMVAMAAENLTPHVLADYLYRLAQEFSAFYNRCHILSEKDIARRGAWLALCAMTLTVLEQGLDLMGIDVPKRM